MKKENKATQGGAARPGARPAFVSINLIRRHTEREQRRQSFLLLLSIFLPLVFFSLLALALVHSFNRGIISNYEQTIAEQEARERERIRELVTPTARDRQLLAEIGRHLETPLTAMPVAPRLRTLAELLPDDFYLERFDFSARGLSISGRGPGGNQAIADLARLTGRLNRSADFAAGLDEIRLIRVEESEGRLLFLINSTR